MVPELYLVAAGIWPHVFQAQRQLPKLRHFTAVWDSPFNGQDMPHNHTQEDLALSSADICCLPGCCAALEELQVSLQAGVDLSTVATHRYPPNLRHSVTMYGWLSG